MTYKMESSFDVATEVQELGKVTDLHGNHVEKGFRCVKHLIYHQFWLKLVKV